MTPRKSENERKVTATPFSRITSHIDPLVLFTFLGLLVISGVILAVQANSKEDCTVVNITMAGRQLAGKTPTFTLGDVVTFSADRPGKTYTWYFGDSTQQLQGQQVKHPFTKAGSFTITLSAKGCSWRQEVVITPPLRPRSDLSPQADVFPTINGETEVLTGRTYTYSNNSPWATRWQWRLQQANGTLYTGSSVSYTFSTPGTRRLTLIVNGDSSKAVTIDIHVSQGGPRQPTRPFNEPPPPPPPPPPPADSVRKAEPTVPRIGEPEFKSMLEQVTRRQKSAADFSEFLCGNLNCSVLLNDKEHSSFAEFCNRISRKKGKYKIETVNLVKNAKGCITEIRIIYDKKGWLF